MGIYIWNSCVAILQIFLFLISVYYLGIAVFSLFSPKEIFSSASINKFAIIIPAHNEAKSLPALLSSLKGQDYPSSSFEVFVVTDRCTDNTLEIAKRFSAIPLTRKTTDFSGKGAVLNDAFNQLIYSSYNFDAFVVIDADNVADPHFLSEINHSLNRGSSAVQGYIDAKNPNSSWLSHAYAIWYWISNRILQRGYSNLGIGCKLGGTGFAITKELLERHPFSTSSMAEDAEYTIKLALDDIKITYSPQAIVYDEKPSSFSASFFQRARWIQGITEVQRDLGSTLIKNGKWNAFLRFWSDLLLPLGFFLFLFMSLFAWTNLAQITNVRFASFWMQPIPFILLNFYIWGMVAAILLGLIRDKKYSAKLFLNLFGFLIYLVSWIPIGFYGLIKYRKKEWYHTTHQPDI